MSGRISTVSAFVIGFCLALCGRAEAGHVTDGVFSPGEWTGSTVSTSVFPLVGNAGGATLYVDQGFSQVQLQATGVPSSSPTTLFLGYDINVNPVGRTPPTANSFFDVFFQVPSEGNDYVARIAGTPGNTTLALYEKPSGSPTTLTPDGSINVLAAPWTRLPNTDSDFVRANPQGTVGFGTTTGNTPAHIFVEFQLDINNNLGNRTGGQNGLYDPSPAFWSGSGDPGGNDPPFTSGIFSLNPDGSSMVSGGTGPGGAPLLLPQDVPEPSTFVLAGLAGISLAGRAWRRKKLFPVS